MFKLTNLVKSNVLSGLVRNGFTQTASGAHKLPDLPYDFNALEPTISAEIMQLHYSKHHAAYVTNLNIAEEKLAEAVSKNDVATAISLGPALRFNGGGHINHSIFWQNLSPNGGGQPEGVLMESIKSSFGSFDNLKSLMNAAAVGVQGSGWAWLGYNPVNKNLQVASCPNQDPLQATTGLIPLLGIDVWEHAYYLQYKNVRPDYVKAIWNVINWRDVADRLSRQFLDSWMHRSCNPLKRCKCQENLEYDLI